MKTFSDNIIFFDTEFTNLDIRVGELLSIGMVKPSGEELYLELEYSGKDIHPWVTDHVLPYLTGEKTNNEEAIEKLREFVGGSHPFLMAYVNQFDAMFWYKLFGDTKGHPAFWIPIDFASILFANGASPESMRDEKFFTDLGIDKSKYNHHNALDDARLLKETYEKFTEERKA